MISDSEHNLYQHLHTQRQRKPIIITIITSTVGIFRVTTFPAIITSVALLMPSTNDSLHPYKLSNLVYNGVINCMNIAVFYEHHLIAHNNNIIIFVAE